MQEPLHLGEFRRPARLAWPVAMSRLRLLVLAAAIPFALWMLIARPLGRRAAVQPRIEEKKREIDKDKGRERVLTTTISGYTDRIDTLQGDITVLQARQIRIQADLDAKRAELARIQDDLRQERIRLVKLRAKLAPRRTRWPSGWSRSTRPTSPTR